MTVCRPYVAGLGLWLAVATVDSAQAQSWNLYSGTGISVGYATSAANPTGAMGPGNAATINLRMENGSTTYGPLQAFTMDTGSTGIVVGSNYFNPTGLTPQGTGSQSYSSSGVGYTGTYYDTKVRIFDSDGTTLKATSTVRVLYVGGGDAADTHYMGVGFNRGNGADPATMIPVSANPFLNVDGLDSKGYVITSTGVTLGVPSSANSGFAMVKLVPNTIDWNATSMTVSVNGGTPGSGTVLQDAGIDYMFITPPPGSGLHSGVLAPANTNIQIWFPGQDGAGASYQFDAMNLANPCTVAAGVTPCNVTPVKVGSSNINVNTGRQFFLGFDYLYDYDNGYVGYKWVGPAVGTNSGQSTPGVALLGTVTLSDNFLSTLPTYLFGATTFDVSGTAKINAVVTGPNSLTLGSGTLELGAANTYSGGTVVTGGTLRLGASGSLLSTGALTINGGTFDLNGNNQTVGALSGTGGTLALGSGTLTASNANSGTLSSVITGSGALVKQGTGTLTLLGANSYSGGTTVSAGALQGNATSLRGAIVNNATVVFDQTGSGTYAGAMSGTGRLVKQNTGTLILTGTSSHTGGTTVSGGVLQGTAANLQGAITNNASVVFDQATTATYAGNMSGSGSLTKTGAGVLTVSGNNSYTGGTTVSAGTLRLGSTTALPTDGALTVNGGTVDFNGNNLTVGSLSGLGGTVSLGSGTLTVAESSNTSVAAVITGTGGSLVKQGAGTLILTGANTYTGPTSVSGGRLAVNGSITSNVNVGSGGNLGGVGTITGNVTNNGIAAPGNSIGTLTVNGSYTQAAGSTYQVESNAAGQADRINVTGAPGTATINGGTVQALADPGVYAPSTTYTILNATGGVTGTYAGVTSNYPFLQASLGYDTNNVYLTLKPGGFAAGASSGNQRAVGGVLDRSVAGSTGDFATVIGTMATFSLSQGQAAMDAISGQNYSGFSTANVGSGLLFMNAVGQQMAAARIPGGGSRVALAEACEFACDEPDRVQTPSPWNLWGSALGATGSVAGNSNAATVTYNAGGVATGIDYRLDPRFLVGLGVGFSSGNQWLSGFTGRGTSTSYQASLYASFTQGAFYLDGQAGYGFSDNQMTRMIAIPGLQPRTATGQTSANQFVGQVETGYRIGIYERAAASLTPFVRMQGVNNSQAAFSETGASSLNLNVAQQTVNSVRSTIGAELAGSIDAGWRDRLALRLRLGWAHEYASVSRPVTASFAGAPGAAFTVFGATPQRDTATVGFAANTAIAERTSLYFRYDGEVGTGTDNHAFNAGLRITW